MSVQGMTEDERLAATRAYLQDHKIDELFAHFMQLLLFHKPENPREFLSAEVSKIRNEKVSSSLFSETDLETMFDMIDVTKQKYVTPQQLRNTCRNLSASVGGEGLSEEQEAAITTAVAANGGERITLEQFKEVLAMQLMTKNIWSA